MSQWTHVLGTIYVDTCMEQRNMIKKVNKYMNNAPKITGSESDTFLMVNIRPEYNTSIMENTPFGVKTSYFQSCVIFTLIGDLRDKGEEKTEQELIQFLKYVADKYMIRDSVIYISDEWKDYNKIITANTQYNMDDEDRENWYNELITYTSKIKRVGD